MELSRESGILTTNDEANASSRDGHDHERATPDVRAPSHSWSLVFWGLTGVVPERMIQNAVSSPAKAGDPVTTVFHWGRTKNG
jgi:hypothetical protein